MKLFFIFTLVIIVGCVPKQASKYEYECVLGDKEYSLRDPMVSDSKNMLILDLFIASHNSTMLGKVFSDFSYKKSSFFIQSNSDTIHGFVLPISFSDQVKEYVIVDTSYFRLMFFIKDELATKDFGNDLTEKIFVNIRHNDTSYVRCSCKQRAT